MTKKQTKQRKQAIESLADSAHADLVKARRLLSANQVSSATLLGRSIWPVVIWCIHQRLTRSTNSKPRQRSTTTLIKGMAISKDTDVALCEQLRQADVLAVMGPETAAEALALIDAGLNGLESTEPSGNKRRRQRADQEPRRRFGLRRLATAASGLFAVGGA